MDKYDILDMVLFQEEGEANRILAAAHTGLSIRGNNIYENGEKIGEIVTTHHQSSMEEFLEEC